MKFLVCCKKTKKNSNPENIKDKLIVFTPFLVSLAPQARKFCFLELPYWFLLHFESNLGRFLRLYFLSHTKSFKSWICPKKKLKKKLKLIWICPKKTHFSFFLGGFAFKKNTGGDKSWISLHAQTDEVPSQGTKVHLEDFLGALSQPSLTEGLKETLTGAG